MTCERKIGPFDCCSVVQGDCLELMKQLPDECVDAVITDPPYMNIHGGYVRDFQGGVGRKTTTTVCVTDPWSASMEWAPQAVARG